LIRKAIVLAAGKGTRLYPLTLAIPKEMIRVGTKPVIEHVIEVLKAGAIKEILIIVGRNKEAIMNYLGSGKRLGVDIYYRIQEAPYNAINKLLKMHTEKKAESTILLNKVKDPSRFGLVKIDNNNQIISIIEKPSIKQSENFKINSGFLSIAGLLILKNSIFDFIKKTKPGLNKETWLTDSVELLRQDKKNVFGYELKGTRYDIGTFEALKEADRIEQDKKDFS